MGLQQVIDDVQKDGERRAQAIIEAARAQAEELLAAATKKVAAYEADRMAMADKDAEQVRAQAISHAEFEARKLGLTAEAELREQLRADLLTGFAALADDVRGGHITKLLTQAKELVPAGKIFCNAKDNAHVEGCGYEHAGDANIIGGIIVESQDGNERLDLSYETLLDGQWREILGKEAKLFG